MRERVRVKQWNPYRPCTMESPDGSLKRSGLGPWVLASDYDALAARVAELEKDAARYRWLRERAIGVEMYPDVQGLVFAIPLPAEMSLNIVPAFVDSCIDAALSGADAEKQNGL